jgi:hypothetical protein
VRARISFHIFLQCITTEYGVDANGTCVGGEVQVCVYTSDDANNVTLDDLIGSAYIDLDRLLLRGRARLPLMTAAGTHVNARHAFVILAADDGAEVRSHSRDVVSFLLFGA